jgi:DNA-binding MarR family transcriptional regulator
MNPTCNCYSLRQATRRVTQLYDRALAPTGLRATQVSLLREVDRLGPIPLNALADEMVMDRATLGHNVRPLLAQGLLQLVVGKDRRRREVSLTAKGKRTLAKGWELWRHAQDGFEKALGAEQAAELRTLLHRVAALEVA